LHPGTLHLRLQLIAQRSQVLHRLLQLLQSPLRDCMPFLFSLKVRFGFIQLQRPTPQAHVSATFHHAVPTTRRTDDCAESRDACSSVVFAAFSAS
jgi:hypothetical protein